MPSPKNVVIVESPAKAKTIEKYLGKDFVVESSYGHIRDLPKSGMNIDIEGGTFAPNYEVSAEKKKRVSELKKLTKNAEVVWLASDEDREGEAIAWHLQEALKLDPKKTKRIVFHEITKPAILKAIENPRTVDKHLVDAQQARRVLDRLVGYELSPVLWRKVKAGLSAGRVQSVAVRLIVEREREIEAFTPTATYRLQAEFTLEKGGTVTANLKEKFKAEADARAFLEACIGADFQVKTLEQKPAERKPAAPFTTSTLQQEASRKLGFAVRRTMIAAQKLYEAGMITYMRTDSVNLSELALGQAKDVITTLYGPDYHQRRTYKTKSSGAQEAHEAVRPTDLKRANAGANTDEKRLYDLIYKRTLASQMANAKLQRTTATISVSSRPEVFVAQGEVITFAGFLGVYIEGTDDPAKIEKGVLPPMKEGETVTPNVITATERYSRPPARYTEAMLVKMLEERGIGRPSTYAPTITTIQNREYVTKDEIEGKQRTYGVMTLTPPAQTIETTKETERTGASKNRLHPTDIGKVVNDFLVKYFPKVVDYDFTAKVEAQFDHVAQGEQVWNSVIQDFYGPFHATVEAAADIDKKEVVGQRHLGDHPETGEPVYVRVGRYGPMVQMGDTEDKEKKPKFASLMKGQSMDSLTLEDAVGLLSLPRDVGATEDGELITAGQGRFGPFVKVGSLYASIPAGGDPTTITVEEARELIRAKKEKEANKYIHRWEDEKLAVVNGRYGPYIQYDKSNYKLPKGTKAEDLTLADVQKIVETTEPTRSRAKRGRTTKKKK